jgi:hypothetical protein
LSHRGEAGPEVNVVCFGSVNGGVRRRVLEMKQSVSLWLKRKDKDGKTHIYAIPFAPLIIIAFIGLLVALLLALLQTVGAWLGG